MSRRESRVSLNVRQSDALNEFENFKKKFLLANKHITKLNSTLSVRIEELNAQISTLYVENLRLRASEIALTTQLKKEREKSRKIIADAEAATTNLSRHLSFLRQSFTIPATQDLLPSEPPPLRARRPIVDPNVSPQVPRLSRPPTFPGINEDEEIASSPEADDDDTEPPPSPTIRKKAKSRLSASRLPLPSRVSSPPLVNMHVDVEEQPRRSTKGKSARRQSGLLNIATDNLETSSIAVGELLFPPRPASPAFGSPIRMQAALEEEEEERAVETGELDVLEVCEQNDTEMVSKKKKERRGKTKERDKDEDGIDVVGTKDRGKKRRRDDDFNSVMDGSVLKLKDVTNSPSDRSPFPPLDINISDHDRQQTPDTDGPPVSATTSSSIRNFLSTPITTPASTPSMSYLPTPRPSSSPDPAPAPDAMLAADTETSGRERRSRKSVNYAEPKLNTKMRKPDPPLAPTATTKKRLSSTTQLQSDIPETRSSLENQSTSSLIRPSATRISLTATSNTTTSLNPSVVKRKKSRPVIVEDEESDGAQADAEYGGTDKTNGWVNVEGRRRSIHHGSGRIRKSVENDDSRRHSIAV